MTSNKPLWREKVGERERGGIVLFNEEVKMKSLILSAVDGLNMKM